MICFLSFNSGNQNNNSSILCFKLLFFVCFIISGILCILAWTEGCGRWLESGPRLGQGAQRGSPCPETEAPSWAAASLAAGTGSRGLEPAPGPPPWETTESQNITAHYWSRTETFLNFFMLERGARLHLFKWCLPSFLWDAELTAARLGLWWSDGVPTLQVASLQVVWVAAPTRGTGGGQGGVSPLLTPWGRGPRGRRKPKVDRGFVQLLLLHQQRVAAGGGAEPAAWGGAGGGARAEGAWAFVTVTKGVQQGEVEALSVPSATAAHIPISGNGGCWVIVRGDGGYLDAGTLDHTRLWNLEGRRERTRESLSLIVTSCRWWTDTSCQKYAVKTSCIILIMGIHNAKIDNHLTQSRKWIKGPTDLVVYPGIRWIITKVKPFL